LALQWAALKVARRVGPMAVPMAALWVVPMADRKVVLLADL
jgi:hypothetical protein